MTFVRRISNSGAVTAYKAFNNNWTCRGFKYEVGKSYYHKGSIEMCRSGFHACPKLIDCFDYYEFDPSNKVAQVRLWGTVEEEGNKLVTNNIYIEKELSWNEVLNLVNEGKGNTGNRNNGHYNAGYRNIGNYNTGRCNIGNHNAGNYNVGDFNTGNENIGVRNSGDYNVGSRNGGSNNIGNYNSGNWNVGDHNAGCFNVGDYHTGWFNTESHGLCMFNKPVDPTVLRPECLPWSLLDRSLTVWLKWDRISYEKREFLSKDAERQGGYLKSWTLKEAIREAFISYGRYGFPDRWYEELRAIRALPNFDPDIFYEITGIKPSELK